MRRVLEAAAVITAHDKTGATFQNVARKIRQIETAGKAASNQARAIDRAAAATSRGSTAIMAAGRFLAPAGGAYAISGAIKRYADAEMAITRIGITADATDEEIVKLHKSLRDLAYKNAKPFGEVAEGLNQLVAGGLDLPQAMPALPAIVKTAQAAGAEVRDIASSALALSQALGISAERMQDAFDVMVAGGKAGKFELRDMARYLASILPAAAAAGMRGEEGLKRVVAMLQVVRQGTGTTEEAAASVANIFAKMESEETVKRFAKFGVDLRKEMAAARKEGKDLLATFTDLSARALAGDLSKIPQLFSDMEFARGMRAMLTYRDLLGEVMGRLNNAKGATDADFKRVMSRSQIAVQQMSEAWDRATEAVGRLAAALGVPGGLKAAADLMEKVADKLDPGGDSKKPKSIPELRDQYLNARAQDRLTEIGAEIAVAERGVALAEGIARKHPTGYSGDLKAAQEKLGRLRSEREMLKLEIAARELGWPTAAPEIAAAAASHSRLPAPALDRDLMPEYFGRRAPVPPVAPLDLSDLVREIGSSQPPAEAKITGAANVNVKVTVEPSPSFLTTVKSWIGGAIDGLRLNGTTPSGSTGSTGRSMPEVGPMP